MPTTCGRHRDKERRLPLQFVAAALATPQAAEPRGGAELPAAPVAVRRAAWRQLGGLDAGLGAAAACGACAWLDLSTRLWLGGWQVRVGGAWSARGAMGHGAGECLHVMRLIDERPCTVELYSVFLLTSNSPLLDTVCSSNPQVAQLPLDLGSSSPAANSLLLPLDAQRRNLLTAAAPAPDASGPAHRGTAAVAAEGVGDAEARAGSRGHGAGGAGAPEAAAWPRSLAATGVAPAGWVAEDVAWCERPELAAHRGRLEGVCARLLQLRYGASPYWHDGAVGPGNEDATAQGEQRAAAAAAGAAGSIGGSSFEAGELGTGKGTAAGIPTAARAVVGAEEAGAEDGAEPGPQGRRSLGSRRAGWPAAWFLGSDVHVLVTEQVRQLNLLSPLFPLLGWPGLGSACPFGAAGCHEPHATV